MDNMSLPREQRKTLLEHVFATYNSLRFGMAGIAAGFPIVLVIVGWFYGLRLQGSMSAYYWASVGGDPPVRVLFVGGLFAIGSFLLLYKGYTFKEDLALDIAAVCAIGVAVFPMSWNCQPDCPRSYLHGGCAVVLFACAAYVAIRRSGDTLEALPEALVGRYRNIYRATSAIMFLFPVAAIVAHVVFLKYNALTYFLELFGIEAFAIFWLFKSLEMRDSEAEEQILDEAKEAVGAAGPHVQDDPSPSR